MKKTNVHSPYHCGLPTPLLYSKIKGFSEGCFSMISLPILKKFMKNT